MSTAAPGWYADPAGTDAERFWDGTGWTSHLRPVAAPYGGLEWVSVPPTAPTLLGQHEREPWDQDPMWDSNNVLPAGIRVEADPRAWTTSDPAATRCWWEQDERHASRSASLPLPEQMLHQQMMQQPANTQHDDLQQMRTPPSGGLAGGGMHAQPVPGSPFMGNALPATSFPGQDLSGTAHRSTSGRAGGELLGGARSRRGNRRGTLVMRHLTSRGRFILMVGSGIVVVVSLVAVWLQLRPPEPVSDGVYARRVCPSLAVAARSLNAKLTGDSGAGGQPALDASAVASAPNNVGQISWAAWSEYLGAVERALGAHVPAGGSAGYVDVLRAEVSGAKATADAYMTTLGYPDGAADVAMLGRLSAMFNVQLATLGEMTEGTGGFGVGVVGALRNETTCIQGLTPLNPALGAAGAVK